MTIYGYLRVSSDEQDVNNQKSGVEQFASDRNWTIDEYISDEGVSGGKDPNKRKLGPLLQKIHKGDVIIASEISRLGRDLYMVMDILHFCMKQGCVIYTVKDRFTLGDDIQSKVLAFAFGLAAEIERQMIRQRTKEALSLRMRNGVLLGRPLGAKTTKDTEARIAYEAKKEEVWTAIKYGAPQRLVASQLGINRSTLVRFLWDDNFYEKVGRKAPIGWIKGMKNNEKKRPKVRTYKDDDNEFQVVDLPREETLEYIMQDLTIPEIHAKFNGKWSYEEVYDTILIDDTYHKLYREHGNKKALQKFNRRKSINH